MRALAKRIVAAIGGIALIVVAYGTWRFAHPGMPANSQSLAPATGAVAGVSAQYFGTTTLALRDGRDAVMVDALLTRPSMSTVMFDKVATDRRLADSSLKQANLGRLDLLLITHTHYDHVLDAAAIAERTDATVVGSPSTRNVVLGDGMPADRIVTVKGGEQLTAGDFKVTVFRSLHSAGDRVPGDVTAPLRQPASAKEYREGGTYSYLIEHRGFRVLVHASANFVPAMYRGVHADVVFLATGGLSTQAPEITNRYWAEAVEATGAKLVVPIHWDDFFQPLNRPLQPLRRFLDNVPLTMARIAPLAARDHVQIRYMPIIAPVDLEAAARAAARGVGQ